MGRRSTALSMLLILFLLVSRHSMVTTISSCHSDRDKDHRPRVSCVNHSLSAVPDGIDPKTQTLVLAQNAFVSLSWATYTTFTHLHELDLSQNLISTIDQSGPVLQHLTVLRLSNNKLTGFSRAAFKSTPSLMEVYLDGNTISSLDSMTFSDLPLLELINLSRNKLQILPPHLLEHISSSKLKNFDVEENLLQHLPDNFFASKYDLPYVFLSKNLWVCTCQVSYLQRYLNDQGHNVYNHTGPSTIENAPESVVCSAPPTLQGRAIVDLTEDEYCISYTDSQDSSAHTTQRTSAPTTALTTAIIQQKVITTAVLATPSVTIQPTTPKTVESSSTPTPTTLTAHNPTTITPTTTNPTIPTDNMETTMTPVLLLCIFSAIFSCMLFLWLIIIYIILYKPIKRQVHSSQGVTLRAYQVTADESLTVDTTEEERVLFLPPEMIRETQPVFRSVLFISKGYDDGEVDERRDGTRNEDEEKKRGTGAVAKIDLLPAVTLHREQETETKDREEVFRKTLYRVISREEEIEGWKEVEENCWGMMERDKERRHGGLERRKTRYSLILREESGSLMEDRKGETEWVVGEWEMKGGGPGSWGSLIRMKEECGLSDSAQKDTPEPVAETSV
ncbi:hypothetical protein AMELA_G00198290 [Ameiurus melas]|uniref:LRRCT domain-containing protein n=1 Tax=Ameiurus melas TaxID=219545 RepID=A0A7J6A8N2_AMEME|nr:hypothetical protein AMELA_G00198290 [Ameiurus melas]